MALIDMFNKGKDMFSKGVQNVKDAANEKKASIEAFQELKMHSEPLTLSNSYEIHNGSPQKGKEEMIINTCLSINREKAELVNKLIPVEETIVNLVPSKEEKTGIEYIFVLTDKRLWIVNRNGFTTYPIDATHTFEIINKGMMSQGVSFDNRAFTIEGSETIVKKFIDEVTIKEVRENSIQEKKNYLCGVIPKKQLLNAKGKGITLGVDNDIVLHNYPDNKLVSINDIEGVQLLVNNTVAYMKAKNQTDSLTTSPNDARKMSVKVVLKTGEYLIEVLPQSDMNSLYQKESSVFINNYEFAKSIVDTIYELIKPY